MFITFPICRTNPGTEDEEENTESVDNWEVEDADRIIEARGAIIFIRYCHYYYYHCCTAVTPPPT